MPDIVINKLTTFINEWEASDKFKNIKKVKDIISDKEKKVLKITDTINKFKSDIEYCIIQAQKFIDKMERIATNANGIFESEPRFEIHNSFFYVYVDISIPKNEVDATFEVCQRIGKIRQANLSVVDKSVKSAKNSVITTFISFNITPTKIMD